MGIHEAGDQSMFMEVEFVRGQVALSGDFCRQYLKDTSCMYGDAVIVENGLRAVDRDNPARMDEQINLSESLLLHSRFTLAADEIGREL